MKIKRKNDSRNYARKLFWISPRILKKTETGDAFKKLGFEMLFLELVPVFLDSLNFHW